MMRCALLFIALAVSACSTPGSGGVTRSECLAIAEAYRAHRWQPTAANVFHGIDSNGVRVDTPDAGYRPPGAVPGWWEPGQVNEGIPYQWGGFATPEQFDRELASGLAAGDVYTQEKRRLLDAAVSRHATGIDCSGFVSRCWKLPRSYSTREFAGICDPLTSWADLRPRRHPQHLQWPCRPVRRLVRRVAHQPYRLRNRHSALLARCPALRLRGFSATERIHSTPLSGDARWMRRQRYFY